MCMCLKIGIWTAQLWCSILLVFLPNKTIASKTAFTLPPVMETDKRSTSIMHYGGVCSSVVVTIILAPVLFQLFYGVSKGTFQGLPNIEPESKHMWSFPRTRVPFWVTKFDPHPKLFSVTADLRNP